MTLRLDQVGKKLPALHGAYDWKDTVLYALGVGAKLPDELDYLFEMNGPKVLPTYAVVPGFPAMAQVLGQLGGNLAMMVHGEHTIRLHRAIPAQAATTTVAEIQAVYDKGKGALAVVEARTSDDKGEPLFDNCFSIFIRGAGGFGGDRGPEKPASEPPARPADFVVSEGTSTEQAALYRLGQGDFNPLHISPQLAKLVGFDRPILHGLCTYGFAGRALLAKACGGDPLRLKAFSARFKAPVFPGDTLTTSGWKLDGGTWALTVANQHGQVVLSHGAAEIAG